MTDKQSIIFFFSLIDVTFSTLGWLIISMLSVSSYIWWLSVPIMIFITVVGAYLMTETLDKERQNDR